MTEQEEMKDALIEKFYELSEIHEADYYAEGTDQIIAAANVMDTIYNTLYNNPASQK